MPSASEAAGLGAPATVERPASAADAAELLGAAAASGLRVAVAGSGSRAGWGRPARALGVRLETTDLDAVVEFNQGDLTTVLAAGTPLARAQATFEAADQMLALDPPEHDTATIGGLVATGDSGPLRHRYGAVRDLILGVQVALPDGSLARAGGHVIKNVAGYDLAKLMCGAFGTLGAITEVVFRLHPRPAETVTAIAPVSGPAELAAAAAAVARAPLELLCLDVAWQSGRGAVLARAGASAARGGAEAAARCLRAAGLDADLLIDDEELWAGQRNRQRAGSGEVSVRISHRPSQLADLASAAEELHGRLVGRAALGLSWVVLPGADPEAVAGLRRRLAPSRCVVQDAPVTLREALDPWDCAEGPELELMRGLKARFDPAGTCNPGIYVGGI